ncbi:hypothetical protein [Arenimonas sp. MALMAid1274]|uniref:hypothetical protein n=1 Tax=Arenimonas sp. MALMAid1274 TaxID=3411630 RepID=UPI003BA094B7
MLSRASTDRLGIRLLREVVEEQDIIDLNEYRHTFFCSYEKIVSSLRLAGFQVAGRPAKSTKSIVAKLKRESIRLSQMQDMAGCRIVVDDEVSQESAINFIISSFGEARVVDRRERASNGYRAVHAVVQLASRHVEIQVRTELQHLWAEYSEKLADMLGPEIKYGHGNPEAIELLSQLSQFVRNYDHMQSRLSKLENDARENTCTRMKLEPFLTKKQRRELNFVDKKALAANKMAKSSLADLRHKIVSFFQGDQNANLAEKKK